MAARTHPHHSLHPLPGLCAHAASYIHEDALIELGPVTPHAAVSIPLLPRSCLSVTAKDGPSPPPWPDETLVSPPVLSAPCPSHPVTSGGELRFPTLRTAADFLCSLSLLSADTGLKGAADSPGDPQVWQTLLSVIRRKGEDRNPAEPFSKGKRGKGFRPIKSERRWQGLLWGSSGWDPVGPMWGAQIRSPGRGARSHVQQLRPSVVTQVNTIYLSARLLLGAARTSVGWRSLPGRRASPLLCKDPTPWRGFLNAVAVAFPWAPGPVAC